MAYKKLKEYHIRKGRYPIRVTLTLWDDGKSEPFVDLYSGVPTPNKPYKHNHFKIKSKSIWSKIKKIIDEELIKHVGAGRPISDKVVEKQVNEEIERLKTDLLRMQKTVQASSKLIKEFRNMKIPDYKNNIEEFEKLIKTAKKEDELQKFLAKLPWLLGLEYENSKPQKIAPGQRYDFYVEKYDGYADIIEIKKPNDAIFDNEGKITRTFSKALQQLISYIDDALLYADSKRLTKNLNFNFLKPKGILIIGRTQDKDKLKTLEYYFHHIEILTYDDVLERGKTILNHLRKEKRKKGAE